MKIPWRALFPLLGLTLTVVACGARSEMLAPDVSAGEGGDGAGGDSSGERACAPNCTIGHRCCIGGCDGPAAVTENDCCTCLDGEVSSATCPGAVCGGGACKLIGAPCDVDDECCTQVCDAPTAGAPKSCVPI